jgi:hypothetical protein
MMEIHIYNCKIKEYVKKYNLLFWINKIHSNLLFVTNDKRASLKCTWGIGF